MRQFSMLKDATNSGLMRKSKNLLETALRQRMMLLAARWGKS